VISSYNFTTYQHCKKETENCTYLSKITIERVGGISGVEVIVSVMLTMLNACYLVSKRVSFKSRFHKIPTLEKGNGALHIPQKNND
jgi:hypothetical protein